MTIPTIRATAPGATLLVQRLHSTGLCSCERGEKTVSYTLTGDVIDYGRVCGACAADMLARFAGERAGAVVTDDDMGVWQ